MSEVKDQEVKKDICVSCKQEGDDLVKPCKTPNCNAKCHSKCLEERFKSGKKCCVECEYPIIVQESTTFNWTKCGKVYFGAIFTFMMIIGGTYYNIKSALGSTSLNPKLWDNRGCVHWKEGINPHKCEQAVPLVILLSFVLSLMFWQFPSVVCHHSKTNKKEVCCRYNILCCITPFKINKRGGYLTMIIMFILSQTIIAITHFVGQYTLNDYTVLTYQTFGYGLITYFWIIIYLVIIIICLALLFSVIYCTINNFTTKKVTFGTPQLKPLLVESKYI